MKKSIFFKIFGGYLLLTTALCGLIIVFSYYIIRSSNIETKAQELTDLAIALKAEITPFVELKNISQLDASVKDLGKAIHTRITVIAPDGIVLSDSEENPVKDGKSSDTDRGRPGHGQEISVDFSGSAIR